MQGIQVNFTEMSNHKKVPHKFMQIERKLKMPWINYLVIQLGNTIYIVYLRANGTFLIKVKTKNKLN